MRHTPLILGATLTLASLTGSRTAFADDTALALAVQNPGRGEGRCNRSRRGPLDRDIVLQHVATRSYPSGLVQSEYLVSR